MKRAARVHANDFTTNGFHTHPHWSTQYSNYQLDAKNPHIQKIFQKKKPNLPSTAQIAKDFLSQEETKPLKQVDAESPDVSACESDDARDLEQLKTI